MVPLSFAQRRLWFIAKLEGPSCTYNIPVVTRLTGSLDADALEAALQDVVRRHETLRTVFADADGEPYQRVVPVEEVSVAFKRASVAEQDVRRAVDAASKYEFDLEHEIPVRACLYSTGPTDHTFILLFHHIAADGWSKEPLWRDLARAYAARADGRTPSWEPLPVQYSDYTLWQRDRLGDPGDPASLLSAQLAYWRARLAALPEEIDLPADRARSASGGNQALSLSFHVPAPVHARLAELARESRASMFMVLQAALAVLLCRLGGGTDIPLGVPVAGRADEGLYDLVGFFVNTLVLRTDVSGNPSFRSLIERIRALDLEAYAHDDIPFERIVEELNPVRAQSRHPLFQTMIAYDEDDGDHLLELPGLRVERVAVDLPTAKFDLSLDLTGTCDDSGGLAGINGLWHYAVSRFDPPTVATFSNWFVRLLDVFAADPDLPVGDAEYLDEAELPADPPGLE